MTYLVTFLLMALIIGLVAVASNPAPYFAAFGLVVAAGVGCGVLAGHGGSFLSLVLFLIYLGGMLVVFAYSAALAAEPFPEAWGDRSVVGYVMIYLLGVIVTGGLLLEGWHEGSWVVVDSLKELAVVRGDTGGVAVMYSSGGGMLIICAWVLLLTLFVVLELTRGLGRGALRAV
uniref:NADH-ubiquinone oxidoreductase chain 6 n=1 Tax=Triplophysa yarkandensis TaxID=1677794 RepID=A0A0U2DFE4_9TELE|nr:NADH dehydrogenase subunit 6 [Triplophysa yarkandensis]AKO73384.1 NADH dehydrogenase subunit 6 [Triplophysa yarkandensis]AMB36305.1 NADH dehydrogenase subunit 6 [Triplophysa yarkandensis]AMD08818.1 NADH dehydrogenase subunit 6 [Triplophysa yarkandensis]QNH95262.1 NADH dehydrogenase subunit 6 [Triplophysa yarkandensis]